MKKIIALVLLVGLVVGSGICGAGNEIEYVNITSSGATHIAFPRKVNEIYIINYTTQTAYVNFLSTFATTNDLVLGRNGNADIIDHREDVQSSNMALLIPELFPNIKIQYKYWKR